MLFKNINILDDDDYHHDHYYHNNNKHRSYMNKPLFIILK